MLLDVHDLKKHFPIRGGIFYREIARLKAVDGVNLSIKDGETLGLVGESGCGKSTLGRTILQLYRPNGGKVLYRGEDLAQKSSSQLRPLRREIQIIFQDPYESLNPRHLVEEILMESYIIHNEGDREFRLKEVDRLLDIVGLPKGSGKKYPHEFSGGQRQRIGIARAISQKPKLIVCDEAVSALDVSIQSQIINLLIELQESMGIAYLFISHDLSVVRHISDRVAVMYLGKIVEMTDADSIYQDPKHPYTQALLSANPEDSSKRIILEGDVPSPLSPPSGCRFHPRCGFATERCSREEPSLRPVANNEDHQAACHYAEETKVTA